MKPGPERPPSWSYNPSSWLQRTPIIALGWMGFFFARLMAAYQLGYIDSLWDPFFGHGTEQILNSDISLAWPISDAGLGVFAYTIEALMGYMGGTDRWRTMPWMVTFFGFLVIPLSSVSIFLIIMQPVSVGTWSSYALVTAAAMLVMIPLTLDEVAAWSSSSCASGAKARGFGTPSGTATPSRAAVPTSARPTTRPVLSPRRGRRPGASLSRRHCWLARRSACG